MAGLTIQQAFELAVYHHQAGRLREAQELYQQIIAFCPDDPDAIHNLGVIALQLGRNEVAASILRRAVALRPDSADAQSNLGNASLGIGRLDEAIAAYQSAVALRPIFPTAWNNLGVALKDKGELSRAVAVLRHTIQQSPDFVEAYYNLGMALSDFGEKAEAIVAYRKAIALRPDYAEARCNLGNLLSNGGQTDDAIAEFRLACKYNPNLAVAYYNLGCALTVKSQNDEAIVAFGKAINITPDYAEAYDGLGNALNEKGKPLAAKVACERAIAIRPDFAGAYNNLGVAYRESGEYDQAIEACKRAVALNHNLAEAFSNLGAALRASGETEQAVKAFRKATDLNPQLHFANSNLLFSLHFDPAFTPAEILQEHQRWAQQCTKSFPTFAHTRETDLEPYRKIKVGYVSPDFTSHAVGRFMVPVMDRHNRHHFEVHCFSNVSRPDVTTEWFRNSADYWHEIRGKNDRDVAELIRDHKIDILVDLALHGRDNRLLVFARKPAPVQVTFLAYCSTSGMATVDYLITDPYLLPTGEEQFTCEQPLRLSSTYWCFRPLPATPDVGPLPAHATGRVTFGCLNSYGKVNSGVLSVWAEILKSVPDSRLVLHATEGSHRQRARDRFSDFGVDPSRLEFIGYLPFSQYLQEYAGIDIGLDPFPFAGGTTTCDALWMGVPVVSLAGRTAVSRGGLSLLTSVGLPELVTLSREEYVKVSVDLASDLPRLALLRAKMRSLMQNSPLMDEQRYVEDIEAAYRRMWLTWHAARSA